MIISIIYYLLFLRVLYILIFSYKVTKQMKTFNMCSEKEKYYIRYNQISIFYQIMFLMEFMIVISSVEKLNKKVFIPLQNRVQSLAKSTYEFIYNKNNNERE